VKQRVVLVDDEELARRVLREFLAADPEIEIVAECANGVEAVKAVQERQPDLLLLDIQMPKLDGFEVLELVQSGAGREVGVVFVTAHDQHALRAFEVHAVDFLLKPFSRERLYMALQRARERRGPAPSGAALAAAARSGWLERIAVRDGPRVSIIPAVALDYAEAQDDYVALASGGKKLLKQQTIASLEAALDPAQFVRIHRSYLVRLAAVARIEPAGKDSHLVVLAGGERLPVSRARLARLRTILGA